MFHISVCTPPPSAGQFSSSSHFRHDRRRSRSLDELLRHSDDEARARSGSSACRASRSRGDGEREATASRVSAVVTLRATTPSAKGGGGRENEGDEGGARLVRAHGGEKSRAPHPPWHVRGGAKEVWKGDDLSRTSLSLSLSALLSPASITDTKTRGAHSLGASLHCTCACMRAVKISLPAGMRVCAHRRSVGEKYWRVLFSLPARERPPPAWTTGYIFAPATHYFQPLLSAPFVGGHVGRANKYVREGEFS